MSSLWFGLCFKYLQIMYIHKFVYLNKLVHLYLLCICLSMHPWCSQRNQIMGQLPWENILCPLSIWGGMQIIAWLKSLTQFPSEHFVYLELDRLLKIYQTYLHAPINLFLCYSFTYLSNLDVFLELLLPRNQTVFQVLCHFFSGTSAAHFPDTGQLHFFPVFPGRLIPTFSLFL